MQDDPNQNFGFIISDIARLLRRNFDRRAQTIGLTRSQWQVLLHLRRQDGLRQNELANLLDIQPISLTRMIDRMVKSGMVERRADPEDRRANRIFLTDKATPLIGKLKELGKKTREEALAGVSPIDLEKLMETLLNIRANFNTPTADDKK